MPILQSRLRATVLSSISILNIALCCSAAPALSSAVAGSASCKYHYYQESAEINGHTITTEYYEPDGHKRHPLVFMLHGSAGAFSLRSDGEPPRDNFGEKTLASSCFVVALPHYMEAIGLRSVTSKREIVSLYPVLLAATDIMLSKAESRPSTRNTPVFLFGESLGGYLSLALALRRSEVAAVSEFSGGLPPQAGLTRASAPRVLISHGAMDDLVPISEAKSLQQFCIDHNVPVEFVILANEGHYLSAGALARVLSTTVDFFRTHPRS